MEWKSFEVTEYNDEKQDNVVIMNSERGRIYVKVGSVDIMIAQSDDGLGLIIDATDSEEPGYLIDSMCIEFNENLE
jgi:hypothetical protein